MKFIKISIMALIPMLSLASECGSSDECLKLGIINYQNHNYEKALEYGDIACRKGKDRGCALIGRILVEDPSSSAEKMINQYKDECNNNNTSSCNNLATIHNGVGFAYKYTKENPILSAEYYRKACDGGHKSACDYETFNSMGMKYYEEKNFVKSNEFFKSTCDGGNMSGCYNLGSSYIEGEGVQKDKQKAVELLKKACDGGNMNGCRVLADHYYGVNDFQKASELDKKACDGGISSSCYSYAFIDENKLKKMKDGERYIYYRKACDGGYKMSCKTIQIHMEFLSALFDFINRTDKHVVPCPNDSPDFWYNKENKLSGYKYTKRLCKKGEKLKE